MSSLRFWVILAVCACLRALAAVLTHPCYDEAYYHAWSLAPQLAYYDHPPLVAWAMTLSGRIFGESIWTVRFWPLAAGTLLPVICRSLVLRMTNGHSANTAGVLLAVTPVFVGNGFLMTPDTLLALCWALAMAAAWLSLTRDSGEACAWLLTGLAIGVGLLSKYTMILFFIAMAGLWLSMPGHRRRILAGMLLSGAVALICFSPVILWNARHDWISFCFQLQHGLSSKPTPPLPRLADYAGGLLLTASPVLGLLCFHAAWRGLRRGPLPRRFLAIFFWTVILFFGIAACRSRVEANWPMMAFVSGMMLVGMEWLAYPVWLRRTALGFAVVPVLLVLGYLMIPPDVPLTWKGRSIDPSRVREFVIGPEAARMVREARRETGVDFVVLGSHQLFGQVSFHAPELRNDLWLCSKGRLRFPWINPARWSGQSALIVTERPEPPAMDDAFVDLRPLRSVEIPYKKFRAQIYYLWIGTGFHPGAPGLNSGYL